MKLFAYFAEPIPDHLGTDDAKAEFLLASIREFAVKVLPPECREARITSEASEHHQTPFADRPGARELLRETRPRDFVMFRSLRVFRSHNDAIEALWLLLARRVTVLFHDSRFAIEPQSSAADLLRALRGFDSFDRSCEGERRKALARRRERPLNQFAPHGWQWVRDAQGIAHKVPCERERRIMAWLLEEKPNCTWEELHALAKQRHIKARTGKPASLRVLRRMHQAALEMVDAGELQSPLAT
jgi:hypothetical protein